MVISTLALIVAGVTALGSLISGFAADAEKQAALKQQQEQDLISNRGRVNTYQNAQDQITNQLNNQLQSMDDQLNIDKDKTYTQVKDSFRSTYLGQLQAEMGYMDQVQQGAEVQGNIAAATGAAGTKQNSRLAGIVSSQMDAKLALARQGIDRGLRGAVGQAEAARDQFKAGSAYMTMYNNRVSQLTTEAASQKAYTKRQFDLGTDSFVSRRNYMHDAIDSADPWNGWNILGNLFNAGGSFLGTLASTNDFWKTNNPIGSDGITFV
jgi:hypothetical protein